MKTIGLIGGMSWESSASYYRILNETVRERLGGHHSAPCILFSIDFAHLERCQHEGDWEGARKIMVDAARRLERGGADIILICANTMHKLYQEVQSEVTVPVLHIVDAVARELQAKGLKTVGLLGTRYTMEQDFYTGRLKEMHGITTIIPDPEERECVHRVIYEELCLGIVREPSKEEFRRIIESLVEKGAEGIILGCTEIPMLMSEGDADVPMFDTTRIHAQAAVNLALPDDTLHVEKCRVRELFLHSENRK